MTAVVRHRAHSRARERAASRPSFGWGWLAGVVAAVLTAGAWTLAAPPVSAPDDQYHVSSIWCAHGDDPDRCAFVPGDAYLRNLPAYTGVAATCFAGKPDDSAVCQKELLDDTDADTGRVAGNWWGHAYPPVYYWVMGWLTSTHFELSVIAMRLLGSLSVIALLAWLTAVAPRSLRPAVAVPLVVLSVPIGLFLLASTNPSGWAIGSAAVVLPAIHAAFGSRGRQQLQLCAIALLGAVMGAGARSDACLFTAMAVVLAAILNVSRLRAHLLVCGTAVACAAVAAYLFLGSGQSGVVSTGFGSTEINSESLHIGWFELAMRNLAELPVLWGGVLGSGPMGSTGSLDTGFPTVVGFLLIASVTVLLYASWRRPRGPLLVCLVLAAAAPVVYPVYLLGRSDLPVGAGIQPRYLLPLLVMLAALLLLNGGARLTRATAWGLVAALSTAHCIALHVQMRRYISGRDVSSLSLGSHREWWWDQAPPPDLVWVLGSLAFAVLAAAVLRTCVAPPEPDWENAGAGPTMAGDRPT
jgi:hypothetical protein